MKLIQLATLSLFMSWGRAEDTLRFTDQPHGLESAPLMEQPHQILPTEIWEAVMGYLPPHEQSKLTAVHPYFRDNFFWIKRCETQFFKGDFSLNQIQSFYHYQLIVQRFQKQLGKYLQDRSIPESYAWMIELAFKEDSAGQLKRYLKCLNHARHKIERIWEKYKENPQLTHTYLRRIYYKTFAAEGDEECRQRLNEAAFFKDLGFTDKSARRYLEFRVERGDRDAQKRLNHAAHNEDLGFTEASGREYLKLRADLGDVDAQNHLNEAIYRGFFGFKIAASRRYLEKRAFQGDVDAQQYLNLGASEELLGFTSATGRRYLMKRAALGDENAQQRLNRAACRAELGFDKETGRHYLMAAASNGSRDAQIYLNKAAFAKDLGFTKVTGRKYLVTQAAKGDQHAQEQLNEAAYRCSLGFTSKTGKDYLQERAKQGDLDALKRLNLDAYYFGMFGAKTDAPRTHLESWASKGNDDAQKWLNGAALNANLGFSSQEGGAYLQGRCKIGDCDAIKKLAFTNRASFFDIVKFCKMEVPSEILNLMLARDPAQTIILRWLLMFHQALSGQSDLDFKAENKASKRHLERVVGGVGK
ncbi:hypothetical protein [Candidatus Odyssella thessalonicensis]|uniref:hypothetical protein n=1 Tax=Candidatus Odyssella thessalonicensis TaxID=84647 RepID=UPI000225C121|nr:hypothetical protein [Candidatus Odyssella thessalonicensis]